MESENLTLEEWQNLIQLFVADRENACLVFELMRERKMLKACFLRHLIHHCYREAWLQAYRQYQSGQSPFFIHRIIYIPSIQNINLTCNTLLGDIANMTLRVHCKRPDTALAEGSYMPHWFDIKFSAVFDGGIFSEKLKDIWFEKAELGFISSHSISIPIIEASAKFLDYIENPPILSNL